MGKLTMLLSGMILQVTGVLVAEKPSALEATRLQICSSPVVCLKIFPDFPLNGAFFLIKKIRRLKIQRFPVMADSCGDIPTKSEGKRVAG